MNEEIALDLMEISFSSPKDWSRIQETCKKQGFLLDVIGDILVQVDEFIMPKDWPETFRIKDVERYLRNWGHSGDKNLTRKIQWVLRCFANQGYIDIDVDPSTMEWICTPVPEETSPED